jgi:DNA polymerase-3 subunit beta
MTGPTFTIEAAQFRTLLQTVSPAVKAKSPLPVLGGVQLTAGDGTLTAWATDLEKGVLATAPAVVTTPGTVVVAHDLLHGLASRLAGPVACSPAKDALAVEAGSVKAKVRCYPDAGDFPAVPAAGETAITLPAASLLRLIERTAFSANETDTGRPQLMGVYVCPLGDAFHAAAADGYRLAVLAPEGIAVAPGSTPGGFPPVLVPAAALTTCLAKLLKGTAAEVEIRLAKRGDIPYAVTVVAPTWTFSSRLIEGTFPDFARIVPQTVETTVTVDAEDLAKAVRTVLPFAHLDGKTDKRPIVRFAFADNTVRIATTDPDRGESEASVGCQITGPDIQIALAGPYVLDILAAVGEGAVEIGCNAPNQAVVFREGDGTWVVMPMVTGGN